MFKGPLFILLNIYLCHSSYAIQAAYDAGKEVWKLYSIIDETASNASHDGSGLLSDNSAKDQAIKNQMDQIHKQLDGMIKSMGGEIVYDSFKSWTASTIMYKCIDDLKLYASSVDEYYQQFSQQINETSYHSDVSQKLMESLIPDIGERIMMIRKNVMDLNDFLFNQQNLSSESHFCGGPQIISTALVQLFRMVIVAIMKAHVMSAIATIHQLPHSVGIWMNVLTKEQFEKQFGTYVNLFALYTQLKEKEYLRACEPVHDTWIRDKSFYELEGTFQTAIFGYRWMNCKEDSCNDIWFKKADECNAGYYNERSSCSATLSQCTWLNAMHACVLKSGPYKFQYVNSSELGLLGMAVECTNDKGYIIEEGTSWDLSHTSCICNCDGDHNKVSLLRMSSNVKSNKVITGLRFVRKNQILHIQPKEGKLDAGGYIYPYSERWIPITENIPTSQIHSVDREHRAFFLDDVQLPAGFVLTGVKFNKVTRGSVIGFAIEIFGVPFHYKSGKLNSDTQFMVSNQESNQNPGQPLSFAARSPVFTTGPHLVSTTDMNYVVLERSNLQDDVGQSTLPFFDAVPIHPHPPSVLGGIGIFHKGHKGFAGFISLRVYGIKYSKYFTDFEINCMKNGRVLFNHSQCSL